MVLSKDKLRCPNCLQKTHFVIYESGIYECKHCGANGRGIEAINEITQNRISIEKDGYFYRINIKDFESAKHNLCGGVSIEIPNSCVKTLINILSGKC